MNMILQQGKRGIKWTFTETLKDLDFADDVTLLSHWHRDVQSKNKDLARMLRRWAWKWIPARPNSCTITVKQQVQLHLFNGRGIEKVKEFTYLGALVAADGNSEIENNAWTSKARGAFAALKSIWKKSTISLRTKILFTQQQCPKRIGVWPNPGKLPTVSATKSTSPKTSA